MKYTIGLIAAVAAIGSSAQSFADLPECGKTCLQGVLDKAVSDLGCDPDDAGCLCSNVNFTYGIRDCSLSACKDQADGIINYGAEYCRNEAGVIITTASAGPNADATAATPGTDGSAPSETPSGNPDGASGPATSGIPSNSDATSGTAPGSPTGVDDSNATDEEGGVTHNTAAPAGLLAAVGIAAILI